MIKLNDFLIEQLEAFISLNNLEKLSKVPSLGTERMFKKIEDAKSTLDFISEKIRWYESFSPEEIDVLHQKAVRRNKSFWKYERSVMKKARLLGYEMVYEDEGENFISKVVEEGNFPTFEECAREQKIMDDYVENLKKIYSLFGNLKEFKDKDHILNRNILSGEARIKSTTRELINWNFFPEKFNQKDRERIFGKQKEFNNRFKEIEEECIRNLKSFGFEIFYSGRLIDEILRKN